MSSIFGNAPIAETQAMATDVVKRFGPPNLEVERGAASAEERGLPCPAVAGMAQALAERPLHLVALGPVTNIASLLELHPELASRILSIVMVAARRPGQSFISQPRQPGPFPDLNFDCDPEAMQRVLDSPAPLIFAPWEVSSHVWLNGEDLDHLEEAGESGAYIAGHARSWLALWREEMGAPGFNPFDTLAIAALSHPDWLAHFRCGVWIEDGPNDTAPPEEQAADARKPHLLVDAERLDSAREAIYCYRPDPRFKPMLLERLGAGTTDMGSDHGR